MRIASSRCDVETAADYCRVILISQFCKIEPVLHSRVYHAGMSGLVHPLCALVAADAGDSWDAVAIGTSQCFPGWCDFVMYRGIHRG